MLKRIKIQGFKSLVNAMNLARIAQIDRAIDKLLRALHKRFQLWQQTEN